MTVPQCLNCDRKIFWFTKPGAGQRCDDCADEWFEEISKRKKEADERLKKESETREGECDDGGESDV